MGADELPRLVGRALAAHNDRLVTMVAHWQWRARQAATTLCNMLETMVLAGILRHGRDALRKAYARQCDFFDHDRQSVYEACLYVARIRGKWIARRDGPSDHWTVDEYMAIAELSMQCPLALLDLEARTWPLELFNDLIDDMRAAQSAAAR
jgi:hypothetical protein